MNKYLTPSIVSRIFISFFLIIAACWQFKYGVYDVLRWSVFVICGYHVRVFYLAKRYFWLSSYLAIAILFNPIIKIHFSRNDWKVIDSIVGIFLLISIFMTYNKPEQKEEANVRNEPFL